MGFPGNRKSGGGKANCGEAITPTGAAVYSLCTML